jgi:hypothetical protein
MSVSNPKKTLAQVIAAIEALDLTMIKFKCTRREDGYGWSDETADAMEVAYKRYLILHAKYPEMTLAPEQDIDRFWHMHILDTRKYAADCDATFGHFLHHFPYLGLRGADDAKALDDAFEKMQALYAKEFGEAMPKASAWCAVEPKSGAKAAWCAKEPTAEGKAAWCAVEPTAEAKAAWCAVEPTAEARAAWCAVEPTAEGKAAWCAVEPTAEARAAWCAVEPQAEGKAAWCAVEPTKAAWCAVEPTVKAEAAWCAIEPATQAAAAAWCAIEPTQATAKPAWCAVEPSAVKAA